MITKEKAVNIHEGFPLLICVVRGHCKSSVMGVSWFPMTRCDILTHQEIGPVQDRLSYHEAIEKIRQQIKRPHLDRYLPINFLYIKLAICSGENVVFLPL